jgi:hypothetical protein
MIVKFRNLFSVWVKKQQTIENIIGLQNDRYKQ